MGYHGAAMKNVADDADASDDVEVCQLDSIRMMLKMHSKRMTIEPRTLIRRCGFCHFSAQTMAKTMKMIDDGDFVVAVDAVVVGDAVKFVRNPLICDPDRFRNLRRAIELD